MRFGPAGRCALALPALAALALLLAAGASPLAPRAVAATALPPGIGPAEANDTNILDEALAGVQAVEPSLLAPSLPASIEAQTVQPALTTSGEQLVATSTLTSSTVSEQAGGEFAVETSAGEMPIRPLGPAAATLAPVVVNGVGALFAGDAQSLATLVRPSPLGDSTTVALDSPAAPDTISWEVSLDPGQRLVPLPGGGAAVLGGGASSALRLPPSATALDPAMTTAAMRASISSAQPVATGTTRPHLAASPAGPPPAPAELTAPLAPARRGEARPQATTGAYAGQVAELASVEARASRSSALLAIAPPHAVDGAGGRVDAKLSVAGNRLTLSLAPRASAPYPLLATLSVTAPSDAVSAARHRAVYGLADDRPRSFGSGFSAQLRGGPLRVGVARLVLPYEAALTGGPELVQLREWLHAVGETRGADGQPLQPYITLWSRACLYADGEGCTPPPAARYSEAVDALMREFGAGVPSEGLPPVKLWGAWNEPNDAEARFPASAAGQLWQIADAVAGEVGCGCEVAAGEFAGFPAAYAAQYKDFMLERGLEPAVWGMHDYGDLLEVPAGSEAPLSSYANRRLRELLALTSARLGKPRIWLSEQGVELENGGGATRLRGNPELQGLAAEDFLRLASESNRVQLVDYYMQGAPEGFSEADGAYRPHPEAEGVPVFDSSLFTEAGAPTEALCVIGYGAHVCPPGA